MYCFCWCFFCFGLFWGCFCLGGFFFLCGGSSILSGVALRVFGLVEFFGGGCGMFFGFLGCFLEGFFGWGG